MGHYSFECSQKTQWRLFQKTVEKRLFWATMQQNFYQHHMVTENHNTAENGSLGLSQISQGHWNLFKFIYCLFIGIKNRFSFSECNTERVKSEPINEAKTFSWMDLRLCRTHDSSITGFFFWQLPLGVATWNPISKKY